MVDLFEKCMAKSKADEAREMNIYPYFHSLSSMQNTVVEMEGKRRIMLGSNNYLGLTANEEVIEAGIEAERKLGSGCSGSRFLNGTLDIHLELEAEIGKFLGVESVVTFPTGFQTNIGIVSALVGKNDYIIMDRENHASIYDGCKLSYGTMLRYKHGDMESLEKCLQQVPESAGCLVVTDGVFSMAGDIAKLPEICALAEKYGARVMVDDAHGIGVIGEGGRGTASYYGLEDKVDIYMGSLSKALASQGGYLAASERICDYVRHNSRPFIFSTSMPPASAAVALKALRILEAHPEMVTTLQGLSKYMRNRLNERNVKMKPSNGDIIPIVPIYTYELIPTLTITKELYEAGVYVNAALPPATPPHEALLRNSLMATHTTDLIDEAVDIIAATLKKHNI
ncbi:MAG: pyridoxal phosphate-dependent aminotransferase family protein [Lachnospiraceae bacterium]|nr:pyridoxal phosphate-dependent aminotransferase family protein [Lachnospiraceae bacterium]